MELAHPNLLKIYAAGSSVLNGVPIVYVVMERADESLKSVLAERALTGDETRELIEPSVAALQYLHKNGYAHSRLSAIQCSGCSGPAETVERQCDPSERRRIDHGRHEERWEY